MSYLLTLMMTIFRQSLWDELFSFDDKDVLDEPVDFGHSAFDDHVSPVDNPTHTSRYVLQYRICMFVVLYVYMSSCFS